MKNFASISYNTGNTYFFTNFVMLNFSQAWYVHCKRAGMCMTVHDSAPMTAAPIKLAYSVVISNELVKVFHFIFKKVFQNTLSFNANLVKVENSSYMKSHEVRAVVCNLFVQQANLIGSCAVTGHAQIVKHKDNTEKHKTLAQWFDSPLWVWYRSQIYWNWVVIFFEFRKGVVGHKKVHYTPQGLAGQRLGNP